MLLNINLDVGEIAIKYEYAPVDYHVKIELNIEMVSRNNLGKSYLDYFTEPNWLNSSQSLTFNMFLKANAFEKWFESSFWIKQRINLIVILDPNILFNINTTIRERGDFNLEVEGGIEINNVNVNINNGNIFYNFIYCMIQGNLTGLITTGDIKLKINNVKYSQNNFWNFINNEGLITFDIIQNRAMDANVTGIGKTDTGIIKIIYHDYSPDIGARFIFHNYSGTWGGIYNYWVGFDEPQSFYDPPDFGYIFTSYDFPANNNYNLSLYKSFLSGDYYVNLSSIPNN